VVGRALQREVQRHLHAEVAGALDEGVEVLQRAQLGVDRVVAAVGRADGPRRADVAGPGVDRVVAALAVHRADGVDRGQVDDVEAHRGHPVELLRGRGERAVDGPAALVAPARRPREELVPGAVEGALAVDVHLLGAAAGDQLADRALGHDRLHGGEERGGDAGVQRQGGVAQGVGGTEQQVAVRAFGGAAADALQQAGPDLQVVGQVVGGLAGVELLADGVAPGGPRVAPRVHPEGPHPGLVGHHRGGERVGADAGGLHAHVVGRAAAADPLPHDVRGDGVVPLAPHHRGDGQHLPDHRLAGLPAPADRG
jgi:hypothetical protein